MRTVRYVRSHIYLIRKLVKTYLVLCCVHRYMEVDDTRCRLCRRPIISFYSSSCRIHICASWGKQVAAGDANPQSFASAVVKVLSRKWSTDPWIQNDDADTHAATFALLLLGRKLLEAYFGGFNQALPPVGCGKKKSRTRYIAIDI